MRNAIALAFLLLTAEAAGAQVASPGLPATRTVESLHLAQGMSRPAPGEMQVTVNFSAPFVSDERDPIKLAQAQAQFRKSLYEMAQRECVALVETIADECRMVGLTVNANQMQMMMTVMNANAQYRVVLKNR